MTSRSTHLHTSRSRKLHPHQKPVALLAYIIEYSGTDGLILDPFAGSASTLVAARRLNRASVGVEIDEKFCEIAAKRLQLEADKKDESQ